MRTHCIGLITAVAVLACAHWAVAGDSADRRPGDHRTDDGWHVVHQGTMGVVEVEKTLYDKPGERHFSIHVRVRDTTDKPIAADLRNDQHVIYPNQWGSLDEAQRGNINEEHRKYEPLNDARRADLLQAFKANRLTAIAPGKAIDYFREFNASTRGDVERETAPHRFMFISLDGEQILTDGAKIEQVSCGWGAADKPAGVTTDVFIPVPWKAIPNDGKIVSEQTPATTQSRSAVVGSIYGKTVTAKDIGLTTPIDPDVQFDSRDTVKWELMERTITAFGKPVVDRFVQEKKIDATADEIKAFQNRMRNGNEQILKQREERLQKVNSDLASPDLRDEDKAKLEKERASLENILPTLRDVGKEAAPEAMARQFIVAWKIERELHRTYGGRVIFQQFGPEALDARRRLFEHAENNGDLKFDDAGVRHMFYYYANMKHTVVDEEAIERPWFLDDSK